MTRHQPEEILTQALNSVQHLVVPHLASAEDLHAFHDRYRRQLLGLVRREIRAAELEAEIRALVRSAERQARRELSDHQYELGRQDVRWSFPSRRAKWQTKALANFHAERLRLALAAREGRIRTLSRKIDRLRSW